MNEELKKRLKMALKAAGLSEGLVETFEGQDEETINKFIAGLKPPTITPEEFVASAAFDRYLEEKGFDDLLNKSKKAQSEFDKKTSKALATFKKNLLGEKSGEPDDTPPTDPKDANNPVLALLNEMRSEIASLKAEKAKEQAQGQVAELLAKSKLPADVQKMWIGRIVTDSKTPVADQIAALETEYTTLFGDREEPNTGGGYPFDQARRNDTGLSKSEEAKLAEVAGKFN